MTVSAALVMKLRERTSAGMMECKKFLVAAGGDIELAIMEMRKAGQAKADKKADRIAAEGVIVIARQADGRAAVMLEINSETDFVARDESFKGFTEQVAQTALTTALMDVTQLAQHKIVASDETIEQARQQLVAKIGENIQIRRLARLESDTIVGTYLHGTRIGVLVSLKGGNEQLAKDIAMHVAASRPQVVSRDEVSADLIQREREIFSAQARESGKPAEILEKMIDGRINKFVDEVSLLGQAYVKNPDLTVAQLLKQHQASVLAFVCFEVGEGIDKKEDDFVAEVMAQVRDQS